MTAMGQGLPLRSRRRHGRCTPDSRRLAVTPRSAGSGQVQTFVAQRAVDGTTQSDPLRMAVTSGTRLKRGLRDHQHEDKDDTYKCRPAQHEPNAKKTMVLRGQQLT